MALLVTLLLSLPFRNTQVSHTVLGTNVSAHGAKTALGLESCLGLSGWACSCSDQAKLLLQSRPSCADGHGAVGNKESSESPGMRAGHFCVPGATCPGALAGTGRARCSPAAPCTPLRSYSIRHSRGGRAGL